MSKELVRVLADVLDAADKLGIHHVDPIVLNDGGNLTVHLSPHPIVARVAKLFPGDDAKLWRAVWSTELHAARHLLDRGVPTAQPCTTVCPGPHHVGGTWMTLWEYYEPRRLPPLIGERAIKMVRDLTKAVADFPEPLPRLGTWRNVPPSCQYLEGFARDDPRIARLLHECRDMDARIKGGTALYPAHGDAHPGNLLATSAGWRWIDFEDVSLMPRFWDYASFVGNTALFHGIEHPMVQCVLATGMSAEDKATLGFALRARVVMATTCNASLALRGHGDLDFAQGQIERIGDFLDRLDEGL